MLQAKECALTLCPSIVFTSDSQLNLSRSLGACQGAYLGNLARSSFRSSQVALLIDYKIYFKVSASTRSTIFSGDSVWVLGLVIRSSRSNLVVLCETIVEMLELHIVG
jgi:hypothetical protein